MVNAPEPDPKNKPPSVDEQFHKLGFGSVKLFTSIAKPAAKEKLVRGHRFQSIQAGSTPVNQGEYTSELCVVLYGRLNMYHTEPGGEPASIGSLGPGSWFGDSSALSNQPSMVTIDAQTECVLAIVDAAIFKAIYGDKNEKAFKDMIDVAYRERALRGHLRVVPLFKYLKEAELKSIEKGVEFLDIEPNQIVAKQGNPVDAVYLVRSGAVKVTKTEGAGPPRILSYLNENSVFGESVAASGEQTWNGNYETMVRTNIVKVPRAVLDKLQADSPTSVLQSTADQIVKQETSGAQGIYDLLKKAADSGTITPDQLEIMVTRQSVKGGHALVIDLTKCVRCNACVESCVAVHADRTPRLSKTGSRVSTQKTLASACYHCEIPECMMACSYGAIRRDLRGSIDFIWDNCVGCTMCVAGCPYGVIRMTPPPQEFAVPENVSRLATLPLIGKWFKSSNCSNERTAVKAGEGGGPLQTYNRVMGKQQAINGKAIKCDLCAGMPFEACVYNCPCSAIQRVAPEDVVSGAD